MLVSDLLFVCMLACRVWFDVRTCFSSCSTFGKTYIHKTPVFVISGGNAPRGVSWTEDRSPVVSLNVQRRSLRRKMYED